jgi:hypothetical protein
MTEMCVSINELRRPSQPAIHKVLQACHVKDCAGAKAGACRKQLANEGMNPLANYGIRVMLSSRRGRMKNVDENEKPIGG